MSHQSQCGAFVASVQGERAYQEDTFTINCVPKSMRIFAVYDGHSGGAVSLALKHYLASHIRRALRQLPTRAPVTRVKQILKQVFCAFDLGLFRGRFGRHSNPESKTWGRRPTAGSTAIVLVQLGRHAFLANTGDSRALIINEQGKILLATHDHKPNVPREAKRIRDAGGRVLTLPGEPPRVDGNLALSRAFGDFGYKTGSRGTYLGAKAKVIVDPDVTHLLLPTTCQVYAVLASDGLWDVVKNAEVARSIRYAHAKRGVNMAQVPRALVHLAVYQRRSGDNTTVMVVPLHQTLVKRSVPPRKSVPPRTKRTTTQKQLTYKDLYAMAQRRNLPGRSRMRKAELARRLGV